MYDYESFASRIEQAIDALLGVRTETLQIREWCDQYRNQCQTIMEVRGVGLPCIAIVGAKGQGKTWIARQLLKDPGIAQLLPSGVLSSEATTQLYWIGPRTPEGIEEQRELYLPCRTEAMLDLGQPYLLVDTPGLTDEDPKAAKIAKEALSLSPIQLLVIRRDQLRSAVVGSLAWNTEGGICVPVITCVPLSEANVSPDPKSEIIVGSSMKDDMGLLDQALRSIATTSRFLAPILIEDFEASGDEGLAGKRLQYALQQRMRTESFETIAATRAHRLSAAEQRLRTRIDRFLEPQLAGLASAIKKLHDEADALPLKTIETVLGSPDVLQVAIRARLRAHILNDTGLIWFPYRTIMSILGLTSGAWDRLILSFSGSLPSIFGTFVAWAKNVQQSRNVQWELTHGIRDRLQNQIEDRLEPLKMVFYRSIARLRGDTKSLRDQESPLPMKLSGIEELQSRARTTFEWCVDRERTPKSYLQFLGLLGSVLFWLLLAGPVVAVYRRYLISSWDSLTNPSTNLDAFQLSSTLVLTCLFLSLLPLLVYCMLVFSFLQRSSKIKRIAQSTLSEEHQLVESLKRDGVIRLYFEDPLLEQAEFLVQLSQRK
jgi:hypothetical protein